MNHRKLHLLKPTVYSYPHSNPWLVKTELIYYRLSRTQFCQKHVWPVVPVPVGGLGGGSGGQGHHRPSVSLFRPFEWCSVVRKVGFHQYNPESHFSEMTVSNLWQNTLCSSYTNACNSRGLTSWRSQCEWGTSGDGSRYQTNLKKWREEFLLPTSFSFLSPLYLSLLPSLPWLFFLPGYFLSRFPVKWTGLISRLGKAIEGQALIYQMSLLYRETMKCMQINISLFHWTSKVHWHIMCVLL